VIKVIAIFFLTCACLKTQAQVNYVLNPSFEQYWSCPTGLDQIRKAKFWEQIDTNIIFPVCSPEYCNACALSTSQVGIPLGYGYNHYPRTGNGMVQMVMYFDNGYSGELYQRDYTQGHLYKPLTAGNLYCITFYVTMEQFSQYAINHIGAYLDDGSIDAPQDSAHCGLPQTAYTPQILESTIINDTVNWVKVQGFFTAAGNETFITIGNFFDITHTDTVRATPSMGGSNFSLYLLDDVSVVETGTKPIAGPDAYVSPGSDSVTIGSNEEGLPLIWYILGNGTPIGHTGSLKVHPDTTTTYVLDLDICDAGRTDTVTVWVAPAGVENMQTLLGNVQIFPNPTTGNFSIEHAKGLQLIIYDVIGRKVYETSITSDKEQININDQPGSLYMGQITDEKTGVRVVLKIVKE